MLEVLDHTGVHKGSTGEWTTLSTWDFVLSHFILKLIYRDQIPDLRYVGGMYLNVLMYNYFYCLNLEKATFEYKNVRHMMHTLHLGYNGPVKAYKLS